LKVSERDYALKIPHQSSLAGDTSGTSFAVPHNIQLPAPGLKIPRIGPPLHSPRVRRDPEPFPRDLKEYIGRKRPVFRKMRGDYIWNLLKYQEID
jgi:hypothetical protein